MIDSDRSDFDDIVGVVYNHEDDSSIFKHTESINAVPISELEALADEWENRAEINQDKPIPTEGHKGIAVGRKRSAKELQEVIERHK